MVGLGFLPFITQSSAQSTSSDGSVVVGFNGSVGRVAFRWTQPEGMVSLGRPSGHVSSEAYGVSATGMVIVGVGITPDPEAIFQAFRWTQGEGWLGLGWLPGAPHRSSSASGVSANGSVIVGQSTSDAVPFGEAFRWTSEGGMIGLGVLPSFDSSGLTKLRTLFVHVVLDEPKLSPDHVDHSESARHEQLSVRLLPT